MLGVYKTTNTRRNKKKLSPALIMHKQFTKLWGCSLSPLSRSFCLLSVTTFTSSCSLHQKNNLLYIASKEENRQKDCTKTV